MLNEGRCNSTYGGRSLLNRAAACASQRGKAPQPVRSGGGSNSHASRSTFMIFEFFKSLAVFQTRLET
jgi:hypothetical protein